MPCQRKQGLSGDGQTYICANGIHVWKMYLLYVDAHGVEKEFNSHSLSVQLHVLCVPTKQISKRLLSFNYHCFPKGGKGQLQKKRRASENRSLPPPLFPADDDKSALSSSLFAILLLLAPSGLFLLMSFFSSPDPAPTKLKRLVLQYFFSKN